MDPAIWAARGAREEIAADYRRGLSLAQLAERYGGSPNFHRTLLAEMKVPRRSRGGRASARQREVSIKSAARCAAGEKACLLAQEYGVCTATIYRNCRREGVRPGSMRTIREHAAKVRSLSRRLRSEGVSPPEIAARLCVSPATVRRHLL